ncbi:methyl-accepting chemotaxis sensory transducer with Pas/Pac sensor [Pseudooceanicola antarcticus]|uniref:Methyl-accepting chemotaxis protein n=1 Tax=Pseudooceanicola antarcticus TaxID=1247613 RepID=A0A285JA92_9RHOB|nr:methyl-accepting chemotaxis protein [Pseudooceanicola antarcticus]PJE30810.1 methyl-accepting chemotaxis protein [Pseudooceanicola antarcticus]SNY57164.1 methyl-accepting chemotaxis sensory transducer with Pas/Pac sensor [Pseudooceanicola antarcticus]
MTSAAAARLPDSSRSSGRIPFFRTTFFRATAIVAVCILIVVAFSQVLWIRHTVSTIEDWTEIRAVETTKGLASNLSGAAKFGRTEAVSPMLEGFIAELNGDVLGAMLLRSDGEVLYQTGIEGFVPAAAQALAAEALATGTFLADREAGLWASPAFYGPDGTVVGSFVSQWTPALRIAAAMQEMLMAGLASLGIFLVALISAAVMFYGYISRPLQRVADQMGEVALGRYDVQIHGTRRGDEIGRIAYRLQRFRDELGAAQGTARENAFKSAAVNTSGSALMLLDKEQLIAFANPACTRILEGSAKRIREAWSGFDPTRIVDQPAGRLPGIGAILEDVANGHKGLPYSGDVRWGDVLIAVYINRVDSEEGEPIGFVLELNDISAEKLNEAVLGSIESHQLRIDFDADQRLSACNARLLELLGTDLAALQGVFALDLMQWVGVTESDRQEEQRKLKQGKAISGKFKMRKGQGEIYVEGSVSPLIDGRGEIERMVFIGSDITDSHIAMRDAEIERRETAEQQQLVVDKLKVGLRQLADGDLTVSIPDPFRAEYEQLRTNFNQAVEALHVAMGAVIQNSESIRGEAGEISNAADDLARRTEKQAATLEETAAALDQLTASVKSAASGADEASQIAATAQSKAETGGEVARKAVSAMDAIKSSSKEISKITSVIDDIAFQTNLLALNAGVEAARAGEAGRGFAVVATEVRALAQRSSDAAREINQLISSSGNHVRSGVELVDRTGEALDEIVTSVVDISSRVASIASSAREQSSGLNEINSAMNDLDQVTQQNAAMFEETTAASHALTSEANALVEAASRFRVDEVRVPGGRKRGKEKGTKAPVAPMPRKSAVGAPSESARVAEAGAASWEEF